MIFRIHNALVKYGKKQLSRLKKDPEYRELCQKRFEAFLKLHDRQIKYMKAVDVPSGLLRILKLIDQHRICASLVNSCFPVTINKYLEPGAVPSEAGRGAVSLKAMSVKLSRLYSMGVILQR